MKHPVIRNSSKEPTRKANMVSGFSYFVTKINLTRKLYQIHTYSNGHV